MRQVPAQILDDASLEELESGRRLILIRGDRPLAEIVPLPKSAQDEGQNEREKERSRREAVERLKKIMAKGLDLGVVWKGRDELYDRD